MLCVVTEETDRVIGERRLKSLRDLGARTTLAKTAEEACRLVVTTLGENAADIPFALLYLIAEDGKSAGLCGSSGLVGVAKARLKVIGLADPTEAWTWPLAEAIRRDGPVRVSGLR